MNKIHQKIQNLSSLFKFEFFLLIFIIIFFELIIFSKINLLYYVDVYNYLYQANDIALNFNFLSYTSRGFPFIWLQSLIIMVIKPFNNDLIFISKFTLFIIILITFLIIYATIKNLTKNRICAFFSVFLLLSDPSYIEYSLIGYFEPFVLLMGWLSFYLTIKYFSSKNKIHLILALISSAISGFTRFEAILIFTLPILLIFFLSCVIEKKDIKFAIIILIISIILFFSFFQIFVSYYSTVTRFNILTRIFLGVGNKDVVSNVFFSFASITNELILNTLFSIFWVTGLIIFIKKKIIDYYHTSDLKKYSYILYFIITVVAIIITISFYGYTYKIIGGKLYIIPKISNRFLLLGKSFIIPIFVYGLYEFFYTFSNILLINYHKKFKGIAFEDKPLISRIKRLKLKKISNILCFWFTFSSIFLYVPFTSIKGIGNVEFNNNQMEVFKGTSDWLETSLNEDDIVVLPFDFIFYIINPTLEQNGLSFDYIWEKSGVIYKADITPQELEIVRITLIEEIKNNSNIKYLVVDWMSTIQYIFNLNVTDDLFNFIYLTHEEQVKYGSYRPSILIYEVY